MTRPCHRSDAACRQLVFVARLTCYSLGSTEWWRKYFVFFTDSQCPLVNIIHNMLLLAKISIYSLISRYSSQSQSVEKIFLLFTY